MPSVPSSPESRSNRRRNPSSLDLSSASPSTYTTNGFGRSPVQSPQTPQSSFPQSPLTPRQRNSQVMSGARMSGDFSSSMMDGGGGGGGGNGLGSLADELADAWDDEEGEEEDVSGYQDGNGNGQTMDQELQSEVESVYAESARGGGGTAAASNYSSGDGDERQTLSPLKHKMKMGRHKRQESHYDGSDYGNNSDLEEPGDISPGLETRMGWIESLARRGTEENGSSTDHVVSRVIESLRDLGGQSGIENGATRLITAYTSLTSHLTHQTRTLQTLTHPLLFSPFPLLSADAIDDLIPLIDEGLIPSLPFPVPQQQHDPPTTDHHHTSNPLTSLQTLLSQTSDLTTTLRSLSDTLHESRQLTSTASRRLRSSRELVSEMRREDESRDEGTRWIEKGGWDRKLREREAGRVCGDVVSGFEAVCGEWRERLFGGNVAAAEMVGA
ncbi:hypothetical protein FQN54_008199 [Arachnomyces sp. PD_36]|nr:hypothetical protein FQN54_008199 [Arachnomyces sp. PD_36]